MFNSEIVIPVLKLNESFVGIDLTTGDMAQLPTPVLCGNGNNESTRSEERFATFCVSDGRPMYLNFAGDVINLCDPISLSHSLYELADMRKNTIEWYAAHRAMFERTLMEIRIAIPHKEIHPDHLTMLDNIRNAIAPGSEIKFNLRGRLIKQAMRQVLNKKLPKIMNAACTQATVICALQLHIARLRMIEIATASPCIVKNGQDLYQLLIKE